MAKKSHDIDPMALVPHTLLEIGRVTSAFSTMEDELNAFIADLLGSGMAAGQAVTFAIRNITDRIDLARTLIKLKIKGSNDQGTADAISLRIIDANARRNTLAHQGISAVAFSVDPDEHQVTFRKKDYLIRLPKTTPMKTKEMRELAEELYDLAIEIATVAHAFRVASGNPDRKP
jgi:hypothetical protein